MGDHGLYQSQNANDDGVVREAQELLSPAYTGCILWLAFTDQSHRDERDFTPGFTAITITTIIATMITAISYGSYS